MHTADDMCCATGIKRDFQSNITGAIDSNCNHHPKYIKCLNRKGINLMMQFPYRGLGSISRHPPAVRPVPISDHTWGLGQGSR